VFVWFRSKNRDLTEKWGQKNKKKMITAKVMGWAFAWSRTAGGLFNYWLFEEGAAGGLEAVF
jgi:hypothetical protein